MNNKAITNAKRLCDTMMRCFPDAKDLPLEGKFFYHQGVFLLGMLHIYELCGEEKYYAYVTSWVYSLVQEDGRIDGLCRDWLDYIQPGILLFPLYKLSGNEKYKKALKTLIEILRSWKKNESGGFWHANCHPNQMWLDSLYMAGPIQAQFGAEFGETQFLDEATKQTIIMYDHMVDPVTGLMFHAWDESKKADWSNKETGLSSTIWGRAQGWYVMAILDILSFLPDAHPNRTNLIKIEHTLLSRIMEYRDEKTKLWYQVLDKGRDPDNWLETSCSCLFTAAIAKAIRMGVLENSYTTFANQSFEALCDSLDEEGDNLLINRVCVGTCVCNYQEYLNRPTLENDLHGVGTFLLMCAEIAQSN